MKQDRAAVVIDDLEGARSQDTFLMGPHQSQKIRHEFAFKTLSLVAMMFGFTTVTCCGLTYLTTLPAYTSKLVAVAPVFAAVGLVGILTFLICFYCTGMKNSSGGQYGLMTMITVAESCTLCFLGITYGAMQWSDIVYTAFGGAFLITVALTIFAKQTKYDVTGMGMWISAGFICLFFVGIFQSILTLLGFRLNWLHIGISLVAIVFVSFSMVYDLQLIFGGENRQHQYSVDDYGLAAIQVYLSIIILILRIMEILARLRQR